MELLGTVEASDAAAKPIAHVHTVWELVLHMTAWANVARERLSGQQLEDLPVDLDWPAPPSGANQESWLADCQALSDSYEALAAVVRTLSDEALAARVSKTQYTVETMISGVVEHGVYHAGQIAIILKTIRKGKQQ